MEFPLNTYRPDPYKNFKFHIVVDDLVVAGVSKVSGLKRTTEVISHRNGGEQSRVTLSPGVSKYEPLTLERGITHDSTFEDWAYLTHSPEGDAAASLANFRKNLRVNMNNHLDQVVRSWIVHEAWVNEFTAVPELDANANGVAFEMIALSYHYFERDLDVVETVQT